MSLDSVFISDSSRVIDGLRDMVTAAIGDHEYVHGFVEVPTALLLVEIAKRAEDKAEWFPRGQWATIQNIQSGIDAQLKNLFRATPTRTGEKAS